MAKFDFLEHIWGQLGRLWEVFGAHCISPGDASTGNFIITPAAKVVVIDGDSIHFHKSPQVARRHLRKAWRYLSQFAFLDVMSAEESLQAVAQSQTPGCWPPRPSLTTSGMGDPRCRTACTG